MHSDIIPLTYLFIRTISHLKMTHYQSKRFNQSRRHMWTILCDGFCPCIFFTKFLVFTREKFCFWLILFYSQIFIFSTMIFLTKKILNFWQKNVFLKKNFEFLTKNFNFNFFLNFAFFVWTGACSIAERGGGPRVVGQAFSAHFADCLLRLRLWGPFRHRSAARCRPDGPWGHWGKVPR